MSKNDKILSKETLSERISNSLNATDAKITKIQIKKVVDKLLSEINKSLIKGEEIRLTGSFTFKTGIRAARQAMNLHTRKKMTVPAKRVPKVKFSSELKKQIAEAKVKR